MKVLWKPMKAFVFGFALFWDQNDEKHPFVLQIALAFAKSHINRSLKSIIL